MKLALYFFIFFTAPVLLCAQQTDSLPVKKDSVKSVVQHRIKLPVKKDTLKLNPVAAIDSSLIRKDSAKLITKVADSALIKKDSLKNLALLTYRTTLKNLLKQHKYLNYTGKPVAMLNVIKKQVPQDTMFYILLIVVAFLAFFRIFYIRYFNNLFRVFFNTSLRQNQLTDQLLQAKLPSLLFNIIFVVSGGLFIFFLLKYFNWLTDNNNPFLIMGMCTLCMASIYLFKFITLKFTGWVTGYKEITNTYIFIIFLINKILGIFLLPFIVVMAFAAPALIKVSALIAVLLILLMFLLRFYRSYGLLQNQLKFNKIHFCMYIAGVEVLPVLLIYKGLVLLLQRP